jgi:transcriptional regulator of NAD metabolism
MIISKEIEINGRTLIKHESDSNKIIRQIETGREYSSAVDIIPCRYTYVETDKPIEKNEYIKALLDLRE